MAYLAAQRKQAALAEFRRAVALGDASPVALINLALLTLQLETMVQLKEERKADEAAGLRRETLEVVLQQLRGAEKAPGAANMPELAHCIGCVIHALANTYLAIVKHNRPNPLSLACRYERRLEMTPPENRESAARKSMPISRQACDELFARIDTDGDQKLTKKEIRKGLDAVQQATAELHLSKAASKMFRSANSVFKAADTDSSKAIDAGEFFEFMCDALYDETVQDSLPESQPEPEPEAPKIKAKKQIRLGKTVLLHTVYRCTARRRPICQNVLQDLINWVPDMDFQQSLTMLKLADRKPTVAAVGVMGDMIFEIDVSDKLQIPMTFTIR
eukprot:SAG31_NODE_1421_length_8423_cov_2.477054_3_plen_332_part_00